MGGWSFDLDCSVIMQPNPGWGIIVNFKTIPCIGSAEATICLCFTEGALLDRQQPWTILSEGWSMEIPEYRFQTSIGGAELVKSRVGAICSFAKLFPIMHVEQDLLQHYGVASTLSSTLSTPELEFLFAWTISANSTFKECLVCNNL